MSTPAFTPDQVVTAAGIPAVIVHRIPDTDDYAVRAVESGRMFTAPSPTISAYTVGLVTSWDDLVAYTNEVTSR